MDGWTIGFILVFGIAALVPAVWGVVGLIAGKARFWPVVLGTGWAALLMIFTFISMATDWGGCGADSAEGAVTCADDCQPDVWANQCGRDSGCGTIADGQYCPAGQEPVFDFCERFRDGAVKQPWATWSDLSFIAAGLWLLWWFQYWAKPGATTSGRTTVTVKADNPMIAVGWLSITYCLIVIFMGPPSMWLHASMKNWGGWFDSMSVVIWLTFNAVYVTYALCGPMWGRGRGSLRPVVILVITAALVFGFGWLAWFEPDSRAFGYYVSGGAWGLAELIYVIVGAACSRVAYRRTWWMFLVNVGILVLTMTVWVLFNDDVVSAATCRDRESFPGHGLFHILASFSTIWTYVHFASEQKVR